MATGKKSFLLYCDVIHTVEQLTDTEAGELFKHILRYVNDQDPIAPSTITRIAFEPIKQSLKRDLDRYESICKRNSDNAKKRWDATAYDRIPNYTKNADIDSDSDSDSDIDIKDINGVEVDSKKQTKNDGPRVDIKPEYQIAFDLWFRYKKEKRQGYQKTGMEQLVKRMQGKYTADQFTQCVEYSITQNYQGIFEPKDFNKATEQPTKPIKYFNIEDYDK